MILYRLCCAREHDFESWFRDSAAYDEQRARGLVTCPVCGSPEVEKALMAPALGRAARKYAAEVSTDEAPVAPVAASAPVPALVTQPVALVSEKEQQLRAMLRAVRAHVVANSVDVGDEFAARARRMHEGDEEKRAIRGAATPDEVRALIEDEIEVLPLPVLPDERN
ncbi:hypothetical protein EV667_4464 [Ancylobacter aquaticus]|uniref:DUF1178 family protein n=1 Tax=Ancylobacter aquaticus TaxID=100 RepID=A0A4R1HBW7_ANCAQ|nr:DUF1178 family protein [Ancylobacter aquaticus]TCK16689.1 hypothetical protein EV667_4464 [Ancylobacter aquaticus]